MVILGMGKLRQQTLVVFHAEPPFAVEANLCLADPLVALEGLGTLEDRGVSSVYFRLVG